MGDTYPPLDPNKVHDLSKPERDDAQDSVRAILTLIRIWGRMTNREPEAEGIAISVLQATERR